MASGRPAVFSWKGRRRGCRLQKFTRLAAVRGCLGLPAAVAEAAPPGGHDASHVDQIPKTIWSFWHDESNVPKIVELALASWGHFAPDHQLRLLNLNNYREFLPDGEFNFTANSMPMAHFADTLRLTLLAAFGGVWIDSTMLLTAPLESLVNQSARMSGVHLEAALVEVYFIAAKPKDAIIQKWRDETRELCSMSEQAYDKHLTKLKARGVEPLNGHMAECDWRNSSPFHEAAHWALHRIVGVVNSLVNYTNFYLHPCGQHFWMRYLRMNVAFNSVLGTDGSDITKLCRNLGIHLVDSFQTTNSVAVSLDWNSTQIVKFLMTRGSESFDLRAARGIKLRKSERDLLEDFRACERGSFVCRLQQLVGRSVFDETLSTSSFTSDAAVMEL